MLIDIHCHLEMCGEIEKRIESARKKGVGLIVTQGVKPEINRKVLEIASEYPEVKASLGLYPIDALPLKDKEIEAEIAFIRKNKNKIAAIGEVGMDFKEDLENHERQKEIFRRVISLAKELDKPIIVHSRKAEKECIEELENAGMKKVIMHCFCGNFKLIEIIRQNGWFMTVPTNVKSSEHFQKVALIFPLEQLFCETDSPYLHPDKEWPNEPANVVESYRKIAEIRKMKIEDVEKQIEKNYRKLF